MSAVENSNDCVRFSDTVVLTLGCPLLCER